MKTLASPSLLDSIPVLAGKLNALLKNSAMYSTEKRANAALRAMPAAERPMGPYGARLQSVAYAARMSYEATDSAERVYTMSHTEVCAIAKPVAA